MYEATFKWIAERSIFAETDMSAGRYVELVSAAGPP
jgi:hypothetical protein